MSSKIFVTQQSEEILRVISPATTMTSASDEKYNKFEMSSKSVKIEAFPSVERKTSGSVNVGICQFSMSHYYERNDSDECSNDFIQQLANQKPSLRHFNSADSGMTVESSASGGSGSDLDEFYASVSSSEAKMIRRLPRQSAVDSDSSRGNSVTVDRSFSVDSGYIDEFRLSEDPASSDLREAGKLAKAWMKRNEFRKRIGSGGSYELAENIKQKIQYVSLSKSQSFKNL